MRLVILESPYAGSPEEVERNVAYARLCLRDSLARNESPIASHLLFTQVLDDNDPGDRALGIDAGLAWREVAHASVVYIDLGVSSGMAYGIAKARERGIPVEARSLGLCGGICRHLKWTENFRRPVKIGIIGVGEFGSRMAEALSQIDGGCEVLMCVDEPSAYEITAQRFAPFFNPPLGIPYCGEPRGRRRGQRRSRETRY
jgi:hypothetical protein